MPTNHLGRIVAILIVLFVGLWAIFPNLPIEPLKVLDPSVPFAQKHNLKPGIDMVGGTSLLYEIRVPDGAAIDDDLSTRVMDALKKRVDPDGVKNLVWRPQGPTRLEIQMPLPGGGDDARAKEARQALARATAALEVTNVRAGQVLDAVQHLTGEARAKRLTELASDSASRRQAYPRLAAAWDALAAARERRDAAAQAAASIEFEQLKASVESGFASPVELEQALNIIQESKLRTDLDAAAKTRVAEAQKVVDRDLASGADFPARKAAVEAFVAAHADAFRYRNQIDDAADLKRLLQGSGVLEYHILVEPGDSRVPEMVQRLESGQGTVERAGDSARWARVDKPEAMPPEHYSRSGVIMDYGGRRWVLLDTLPERSLNQQTGQRWALKNARAERDPQSGETHVAFQMDVQGGVYMGRLTANNLKRPMAIVLDDKVISAPTIQSQINENGQITGNYSPAEIRYLVNTLNAGSLPARLADEPISERTVGPQLGADNLRDGFLACGFGLIAVAVFLVGYYYLAGIVAYIGVLLNLVLILGSLAALNATFTLPSVAALVLTLGAAVDANVLIFERLREEQERGFPIRTALRNAYDRAFSAILDSNVVTGITSLVLYLIGSEEVKGFGLTLLLGIFTSLFCSLFVTRTLFGILVDKFGVRRLGSVPLTFPWWGRVLNPGIDWMGKVWILGLSSVAVMTIGLVMFVQAIGAGRMFDIEFSAGTAVTIELKQPVTQGEIRKMLTDAAARQVVAVGAANAAETATDGPRVERRMTVADALPAAAPVSVGSGNLSYEIVTPNPDVPAVRAAVLEVYGALLKIDVPSTFARVGAPADQVIDDIIVPVEANRPTGRFVPEEWGQYSGGVAVFLRDLDPPISPAEIQRRLTAQRLQAGAGSSRTLPPLNVYSAGGRDQPASEVVVLAVDDNFSYSQSPDAWRKEIAGPVWNVVNQAVNHPPSLAKVTSFNPQVAGGTQQDAAVAIVLALIVIMAYVWMRFGNLRYGAATVVALLHDTFFVLAALGFAHFLAETWVGEHVLRLEAFRINLTVVAGVLTVMGYSMADTIVVFDRIREIRGQRGALNAQVVNDAINQTLSRTLLTAGTTMCTLFVMYVFGGPGIHGFTYILLVGIVVGTYSSIAIAAPLLLIKLRRGGSETPSTSGPSALKADGGKGSQLQKA